MTCEKTSIWGDFNLDHKKLWARLLLTLCSMSAPDGVTGSCLLTLLLLLPAPAEAAEVASSLTVDIVISLPRQCSNYFFH